MVSVCLFSFLHAASAPAENLLNNPLIVDVADGAPVSWSTQIWGGEANFEVAPEGRESGHSLRIDAAQGADATAFPLMLYRNEFGVQPVKVHGWDERLDVSAALTEDGRFLTVAFVNATWDRYEVTLALGDFTPTGAAQGWRVTAEDPMAHNHPGEARAVDLVALPEAALPRSLSLPPFSITMYKAPLD